MKCYTSLSGRIKQFCNCSKPLQLADVENDRNSTVSMSFGSIHYLDEARHNFSNLGMAVVKLVTSLDR